MLKFAGFQEEVMNTLNIEMLVTEPLEVVNVEDAISTRVGHLNYIPATVNDM